jgi:hypothetical protein
MNKNAKIFMGITLFVSWLTTIIFYSYEKAGVIR